MKKLENWTVIKYTGDSKPGLETNQLYAVEQDEDFVMPEVFDEHEVPTVWDNDGELHEINKDAYTVVSTNDSLKWFEVKPNKVYEPQLY